MGRGAGATRGRALQPRRPAATRYHLPSHYLPSLFALTALQHRSQASWTARCRVSRLTHPLPRVTSSGLPSLGRRLLTADPAAMLAPHTPDTTTTAAAQPPADCVSSSSGSNYSGLFSRLSGAREDGPSAMPSTVITGQRVQVSDSLSRPCLPLLPMTTSLVDAWSIHPPLIAAFSLAMADAPHAVADVSHPGPGRPPPLPALLPHGARAGADHGSRAGTLARPTLHTSDASLHSLPHYPMIRSARSAMAYVWMGCVLWALVASGGAAAAGLPRPEQRRAGEGTAGGGRGGAAAAAARADGLALLPLHGGGQAGAATS